MDIMIPYYKTLIFGREIYCEKVKQEPFQTIIMLNIFIKIILKNKKFRIKAKK